jgi:hypothetical protein
VSYLSPLIGQDTNSGYGWHLIDPMGLLICFYGFSDGRNSITITWPDYNSQSLITDFTNPTLRG